MKKGNKMKKVFLLMTMLVIIGCSGENKIVKISIPSAQCGMCSINIENALTKVEGVLKAYADMDVLMVEVSYNPSKANLSGLESAISNAGYQANETVANAEGYKNLPGCCKLPADR